MCDLVTAAVTLVGGFFIKKEIDKAKSAMDNIPMPAATPPPRSVAAGEPLKDVAAQTQAARTSVKQRQIDFLGMSGTAKTGALGIPGPAMGTGKSLLGQ